MERKTDIGPFWKNLWEHVKETLKNSEINNVRSRIFLILEFAKNGAKFGVRNRFIRVIRNINAKIIMVWMYCFSKNVVGKKFEIITSR